MKKTLLMFLLICKSIVYANSISDKSNMDNETKYAFECIFEQKDWNVKIKMCQKSIENIKDKWFKSEDEKYTLYNGYWNIGLSYHMKKDYKNAIKFYKKSIENDCCKYKFQISALNNLGVIYNSDNQFTNKIKAYQYFKKAARYGNKNAQDNLDYLCKHSSWACK
jgi:tetratricopeptide (TPR) repeat protein